MAERAAHRGESGAHVEDEAWLVRTSPVHGRDEIRHLPDEPAALDAATPATDVGAERREMMRVAGAGPSELVAVLRADGAEPAHGVQHPVPVGRTVELHQAGIDQRSHGIGDVTGRFTVGAHGQRGVERERRLEHRQPNEHRARQRREEIDAPRDRRVQRRVSADRGTAARRSPAHGVADAGRHRLDRQGARPRRRQLDRQRESVDADADRRDLTERLVVEHQARSRVAGSLDEELQRLVRRQIVDRDRHVPRRDRQRRDPPHDLARDAERFTAGDEDSQRRTPWQQAGEEFGDRCQQMFGVVEHEQHRSPVVQMRDEMIE